ncbi:MAG TPA: DUF2314 domain-containing protein [Candidatus Angelobacter sp.]|nr:DUF2314 domain-containing protein [Candidatus Angelobacter sp.]
MKEQPFTAGVPMAEVIQFKYSVYLLPGRTDGKRALAASTQLLRTRYKALKMVDDIPDHPAHLTDPLVSVHLERDVHKNYAPPSIESLRYRGVGFSAEEQGALQKSREAIIFQFAHSKEHVWSSLFAATQLAEDVARQTGGLIFDEETRHVFTPDSWHKQRLAVWTGGVPELATQFTIDFYPMGEYMRAVTLGLDKFGLPDVVVQEVPQSSGKQVEGLINIFAQTMAEGATFPGSGKFKIDIRRLRNDQLRDSELKSLSTHALGIACLFLKPGKPDEGDPENRLVQLSAELYSGPDSQAKQDNMLSSLFGTKDVAHNVEDTEELWAESHRERDKLPALHQAFDAGLQPGEYIQVKAPFKSDRGHEWMWVEINRWKGKTMTGTLQNDPVDVRDLHAGQIVEVNEDEVFDYIHYYPDKHKEGNTTAKILERTESNPRSAPDHAEMPDCGSP